jgi:DNA-binding Xre family transcriptional regulator
MAISWRLKSYIAKKQGIYTATALQKFIVKKTGTLISIQNLCNYLNRKPPVIRLTTIEIICSDLECNLSAFCQVRPAVFKANKVKRLSYKNTPLSKRATKSFPDPGDY